VEGIAWYRHEGTIDVEGIGIEFVRRAKAMDGARKRWQSEGDALDAELLKHVADELVKEAGVDPLLHCLVTEPVMDGDTIRGVVTESKSGRQAILT
jgi:hypothetical protein